MDAEAKEGKSLAEVEKGILAEIEKLKTDSLPAEELRKVKNNVAAASFRHLSSNFFILLQLMVYDGYGDWREMNEGPRKAAAVTAEDVRRVARTYLTANNRADSSSAGRKAPRPRLPEAMKGEMPAMRTAAMTKALPRRPRHRPLSFVPGRHSPRGRDPGPSRQARSTPTVRRSRPPPRRTTAPSFVRRRSSTSPRTTSFRS